MARLASSVPSAGTAPNSTLVAGTPPPPSYRLLELVASMATDSAAALADELSWADAAHMGYALRLYERRQRRRVALAQANSRWLAKMMFVDNPPVAWVRDQLIRFYSMKMLIKDISRIMEGK